MLYIKPLLISIVISFYLTGCAGSSAKKETGSEKADAAKKASAAVDPKAASKFAAALDAMRSGDDEKAKQLLLPLIAEYPDLSGPQANLGILYFHKNEPEKAEEAFKAAIKINPASAVSYNHLGIINRNRGKFSEAQQLYEKALDIDPDYAYAHLNLGILYDLYLGKLSVAQKHYKRYQELSKDESKTVDNWLVDLNRRIKRSRN